MINDLIEMSNDLDKYGMKSDIVWHQDLQPTPNGRAYKVIINKDGKVHLIEPFDRGTWLGLKYFSPNNHMQFPSFKMASWLDINDKKSLNKFKNCVEKCRKELLSRLDSKTEILAPLFKLNEFIDKSDINGLYEEIFSKLQLVKNCKDEIKEKQLDSVYLSFDVYDPDSLFIVQNIKLFEEINRQLLEKQSCVKNDIGDNKDAFGNNSIGYDEPFFCVVPKVGKITLFAKNEDSASNERYGVNGKDSFVIGNETRARVVRAIQFFTNERRYNKTYKNIGKENNKNTIIICYWDGMDLEKDSIMPPIFFTDEDTSEIIKTEGFEKESEKITSYFEKINSEVSGSKFKIFCLKVPSNGVTYMPYNKSFSVKNVIDSIKQWNSAGKNVEEGNRKYCKTPSPFDFYKLLNHCERMDKKGRYKCVSFSNISIIDVYDFFLGEEKNIRKITNIVAKNHTKMLLHEAEGKFNGKYIVQYLFPIMSIVLQKNKKENYMNELAYLLGQYCCAANNLQELYFKSRGQRTPSKLIGSEHIKWMLNNPQKALVSLNKSILHYFDWAKYNCGKIEYASYYASKIKEINEKIQNMFEELKSFNPTDVDKIAISVGYSVGLTKLDKNIQKGGDTIETIKNGI